MTDLACPAGLTALTILNMHGCEMITSRGIQSICALTSLQHLNLELCNRANGLQHMAGEQSEQQCACGLATDHNKPVQGHWIVPAQHPLHSMQCRHNMPLLHYVIVNTVVLVGLTGTCTRQPCSNETRLVLQVPSSS